MSGQDDLLKELMETFRVEAADHLQTLNHGLLELERDPQPERRQTLLQETFRAAHSLKGAARAVNLKEIEALAHAVENVLQSARDDGIMLNATMCDSIYDALDSINAALNGQPITPEHIIDRLGQFVKSKPASQRGDDNGDFNGDLNNISTAMVSNGGYSAAAMWNGDSPQTDETIRVSVGKMDDLMAQVGELLASRISADQRVIDTRIVRSQLEQMSKSWQEILTSVRRMSGENVRSLTETISHHGEGLQRIIQAYNLVDQNINRDALRLGNVTDTLQDTVRRLRMVPFQSITLILERAVRDASHSVDRPVNFKVEGGQVELDKKILEMLKDPLLHLLRNAVVHGIESAEERRAAKKPEIGSVSVTLRQRGGEVLIAIRDDGRGFDVEALRLAAADRGITDKGANTDDLINLAFMPGVSTASAITALSGRGVGLDVVRQAIEAMQGRISVENMVGQGATINLSVPTSLAMTRGLLVQMGLEQYVIPMLSIEKIVSVDEVFTIGGRQMIKVSNTHLPLISLAAALEREAGAAPAVENPLALILAVAEQRIALMVDDVLTEQELTVKMLTYPIERANNVAGAALLGNGEPIIVLNPADLIRSTRYVTSPAIVVKDTKEEAPTVHVLVVDDSITTRTLEKNILEAAGFDVITATDGMQALQRLNELSIDIVVSDIQMPNMDGFTLTQTLRESNEFNQLPVILVTSLESREDRERGLRSGANAYIVKRGFDQAELLATIRQLV